MYVQRNVIVDDDVDVYEDPYVIQHVNVMLVMLMLMVNEIHIVVVVVDDDDAMM